MTRKATDVLDRRYCWDRGRRSPYNRRAGTAPLPQDSGGRNIDGYAGAAVVWAYADGWTIVADDLQLPAAPTHTGS